MEFFGEFTRWFYLDSLFCSVLDGFKKKEGLGAP